MDEKFVRDRITELRMQADISEYQLSLELGHSKSYIQSISSGRTSPSMTAFFEICSYFNISPLEFFDSDLKSPNQIHQIVNKLKLLSNDDLEFIDEALKRYLDKIQQR
ncbi:MAG: helix-turn-helix domain-containing protein [Lachnospiraceae bacterium]|nr:helix-turn-helix domain-containing protein [Lachnospiraceae bacterium]